MPLYEYECDACGHRFEVIQKFSDPPLDDCPKCGGAVHKLQSAPGVSVQGHRLVHHRLREEGLGRSRAARSRRADRRQRSRAEPKESRDRRRQGPRRAPSDEGARRRPSKSRKTSATRRSLDAALRPPAPRAEADQSVRRLRTRALSRCQRFPAATCRPSDVEVGRELVGEIGPPQREVHHRLQEPELVAGVVADALDLARVDRPRLQQLAQAVGQLNLAGAIALGRGERREDVRRQDVAADDREVGRRLARAAASRPDRAPGRCPRRGRPSGRAR